MALVPVYPPFPTFQGADGVPLEAGYIYVGVANQDPVANPITVYWDEALTIVAAQPIRTISGYPSRAGSPAALHANSDYSITVKDKNGTLVYTAPTAAPGWRLREDLGNTTNAALGDALVGVKSTLANGTARTQHAKNADFISIKDFGAVGDGVTNDTTAFLNALAALGTTQGGTLWCPRGVYLLNQDLAIPSNNIAIIGEASALAYDNTTTAGVSKAKPAVTLKWTAGTHGIDLYSASTRHLHCLVKDLCLDGNNALTNGIRYCDNNIIDSCLITRCSTGIRCELGNNGGVMRNVTCIENSLYGMAIIGSPLVDHTIMTFENCKFRWNGSADTGAGVYIENEQRAIFLSCIFESNYARGAFVKNVTTGLPGAPLQHVIWQNCWFENNGHASAGEFKYALYVDTDVPLSPPRYCHLFGCTFSGGATTSGQRAIKLNAAEDWVIENCNFRGGDEANTIQLTANAVRTKFVHRSTTEATTPQGPITAGTDTVEIRMIASQGLTTYNKVAFDGQTTDLMIQITSNNGPLIQMKNGSAGPGANEKIWFGKGYAAAGDGMVIYRNNETIGFQFYDNGRFAMKVSETIASSGSAGSAGQFAWDDNYLYLRMSTGWRRVALGGAF